MISLLLVQLVDTVLRRPTPAGTAGPLPLTRLANADSFYMYISH